MIVALLVMIALILLFGAGVVQGWLRNLLRAVLGIVLLSAAILVASTILGEDAFIWIWAGGGTLLLIAVLWARGYDPAEAEHRARVKRAQQQSEERRKRIEVVTSLRREQCCYLERKLGLVDLSIAAVSEQVRKLRHRRQRLIEGGSPARPSKLAKPQPRGRRRNFGNKLMIVAVLFGLDL